MPQTMTADTIIFQIADRAREMSADLTQLLADVTPTLRDRLPASRTGRLLAALTGRRRRLLTELTTSRPYDPAGQLLLQLAVRSSDIPQARTGQHDAWTVQLVHAVISTFVLDPAATHGWWALTDGTAVHWPVDITSRWLRGADGAAEADIAIAVDQPRRVHLRDAFRAGHAHLDGAGQLHITFPDTTTATMPSDLAAAVRALPTGDQPDAAGEATAAGSRCHPKWSWPNP